MKKYYYLRYQEKMHADRNSLILVFLILLAGLWSTGYSQASPEQYIAAGSGIILHSEINEIVSALEYSGAAIPVWTRYSNRSEKRIHRVSFHYYSADIENSISTNRDILYAELGYRFSLPVTSFTIFQQVVRLQAGPGLLNRVLKNEQQIRTPLITVNRHNNGYIISSLNAHLLLVTSWDNGHSLEYRLEAPLLLYTYSRRYSGIDMEHNLSAGYSVLMLTHQAQYRLKFSEALQLLTGLRYDMNRFNSPTFYGAVLKSLTVGINWRIK